MIFVSSVVGAYYYLRIVKIMYMDEPAAPYARVREPVQGALQSRQGGCLGSEGDDGVQGAQLLDDGVRAGPDPDRVDEAGQHESRVAQRLAA